MTDLLVKSIKLLDEELEINKRKIYGNYVIIYGRKIIKMAICLYIYIDVVSNNVSTHRKLIFHIFVLNDALVAKKFFSSRLAGKFFFKS